MFVGACGWWMVVEKHSAGREKQHDLSNDDACLSTA